MTPKLPGLLVRYIQQKRCVVFVGAGLSAGAGLPTWSDLLLKGIKELGGSLPESEAHQEELRKLVERGKLLEVADFCKEKLGSAYHQFLSEQVRGDQAETLPPTHEVLMRLPFSAWVTTNYDKLLERAYSKVRGGGFPKTLTHKDTEALGRMLFDGGPFILKAHGDIDRPETVVLASRDYSEIIHANPAFNEIFSSLLLTKALFFVGYSLSDPDFRLLMDRQLTHFKGFVPERYALMTGVGQVERDVLWRTARIQVLSYENVSKTHAEVLQFLQALEAELLPKRVPEFMPVQQSAQPPQSSSEPVLGSMPPPQGIPAPAATETRRVVTHNFSGGSGPGSPVPGSRVTELMQEGEPPSPALTLPRVPASQPASPAPPTPGMLLPATPHRLFIEQVEGMVQLRLVCGDSVSVVQGTVLTDLKEELRQTLKNALEKSSHPGPWLLYSHLVKFFEAYLPSQIIDALAAEAPSSQAPLVLLPASDLARIPWELLPSHGEPICLKRKVMRAPIGIPAQARGAPQVRVFPHILIIEGRGRMSTRQQMDDLARIYRETPGVFCKVLLNATFDQIMAELEESLPDLVHYTGDVRHEDGEIHLSLVYDKSFSAGALRSVLSRGNLPFLVVDAPSSAFAPYGPRGIREEEEDEELPLPKSLLQN